jgi:glycogen(starch) synthase
VRPGIQSVLLTGDVVGGVWTFTLELAEGLMGRGVDVCLATFGGQATEAQRHEAASVRGLSWVHRNLKLEWMDDPWGDLVLAGNWLLELEKQFQPDVVHLNTLCHGALGWKAPVTITTHSCVVSWFHAVHNTPPPESWDRYRNEVRRSLQAADFVTAPSQAMLDFAHRHYGVEYGTARAIPNGRTADRFQVEAKEPFVLAAGRLWDDAKNLRALVNVARRLPWPVFLAGEQQGPSGEAFDTSGCRLLGQLSPSDLAGWFARAAIYALPARYEPFGLSALEAALSGCALVLGDIPSLRETWQDAAIFVPPDDQARLEAVLRSLMDHREQRESLAMLAGSRARAFTQSRMVSDYLNAYEMAREVAAERRPVCAS